MLDVQGTFNATLDAKGRLKLPSALLKQIGDDVTEFILVKGLDACLRLFTNEGWKEYTAPIRSLPDFNKKARQLKHQILNGNARVELDSAERILVPKPLIEKGKLNKDLLIICVFDKIEIWDVAEYEAFMQQDGDDDTSDLAEELLGQL